MIARPTEKFTHHEVFIPFDQYVKYDILHTSKRTDLVPILGTILLEMQINRVFYSTHYKA